MNIDEVITKDIPEKQKTNKLRLTMRVVFSVVKYAMFCLAIVFFMGQSQRSMDPLIAGITDVVQPLGMVVVVLLPLIVGLYRSVKRRDISRLAYSAGGVLAGLAVYSFVIWALGKYGVLAKTVIIQRPVESVGFTIALLICWFLARVAIRPERETWSEINKQPSRTPDYTLIETEAAR